MLRSSLLVLCVFAVSVTAQVKTFRWETELCRYSGAYDPKKYSEAQLRNTVRLMRPGEFGLNYDATVWNFQDISKLNVNALDASYSKAATELKQLSIVRSPFWENVRQKKLAEIEQVYRLSRATMIAYTRPEALTEYQGAESCKSKYASALIAGGEALLTVWRSVNLESQSKNADPARLQRIFAEQMASPDRLKFALVETMAFGWWNCANEFIEYDQGDNSETREREFRKLFIRVRRLGCDEP